MSQKPQKKSQSTSASASVSTATASSSGSDSGKVVAGDFFVLRHPTSGRVAHICGIEHNTLRNAEAIYSLLQNMSNSPSAANADKQGPKKKISDGSEDEVRDTILLMESMQLPHSLEDGSAPAPPKFYCPGDLLPYARNLPAAGLAKTLIMIQEPVFRAQFTGELLALLQALRLNMPVAFCDRNHTVSIDRLLARVKNAAELETMTESAFQALGTALKEWHKQLNASPISSASLTSAVKEPFTRHTVIQNAMLPHFGELFQERHVVMVHTLLRALETSNAVVIVHQHHVKGIQEQWNALVSRKDHQISDQLWLPLSPTKIDMAKQLQSRAILLALFQVTNMFPMEPVTDFPRTLTESEVNVMRDYVTEYQKKFQARVLAIDQQVLSETSASSPPDARYAETKVQALLGIPDLLRMILNMQMAETAPPMETK